MKKIIVILISVVTIFNSCNSKKSEKNAPDGGYMVSVKVSNPNAELLVLNELKMNSVEPIDTVAMDADSIYRFVGKLAEGERKFVQLMVDNQQSIIMVLENGNTEITVDGKRVAATYTIKGQKDSELLKVLNDKMMGYQKIVQGFNDKYSIASGEGNKEKMEAVQNEYFAFDAVYQKSLQSLIDSMGTSLAAVYALNFINWDDNFEFINKTVEKFNTDKSIAETEFVKNLTSRVNELKRLAIGQEAPEITLSSLDGTPKSLSSLRGKYVLIDFWASWCGPCRKENPNVVRMYAKFKNKGFEIFGVSLDNAGDKWKEAVQKDNLTWVHVSDLLGWQSSAAQLYQVRGIPFTVLLDKEGKIIAKNLRGEELEKKLSEIL
jgi:thiol-disulfide isomerase/thioredoxin